MWDVSDNRRRFTVQTFRTRISGKSFWWHLHALGHFNKFTREWVGSFMSLPLGHLHHECAPFTSLCNRFLTSFIHSWRTFSRVKFLPTPNVTCVTQTSELGLVLRQKQWFPLHLFCVGTFRKYSTWDWKTLGSGFPFWNMLVALPPFICLIYGNYGVKDMSSTMHNWT